MTRLLCRGEQGRCKGGQKRELVVKDSIPFLTHSSFIHFHSLPTSPVFRLLSRLKENIRTGNIGQLVYSNVEGNIDPLHKWR